MTAVLEHETLTQMDDETRVRLGQAAAAYKAAPRTLRDEIFASADKGDRAADIVKAIDYAYTYDYVARLVRERRSPRKADEPAGE
jgi:hypothetical protein